jgi:flagellar FliL protein
LADDILDELDDDFADEMSDLLEDDVEEEENEDTSEKETKKGGKKESPVARIISAARQLVGKILGSTKAIIIISVGMVALICVGVVLWLFVFSSGPDDVLEPVQDNPQASEPRMLEPEQEIIFEDIVELEPFERIKLKTSSTMGLISLNLSLELTDARYRKQMIAMEDRIRNIVIQQVENTTWLELRNPEGKIMLKYRLLERMNAIFPQTVVRNIYFTYFIMQ